LASFQVVHRESVGSRRELVANCVHTADADATKQFRRVGVGGVYWALDLEGWKRISKRFERSSSFCSSSSRAVFSTKAFSFHDRSSSTFAHTL